MARPLWLPLAIALVYVSGLSAVFARETEAPSIRLLAVFAPAVIAGYAARRFWMLALPVGALAVALVWMGVVDEDVPLVAMLAGLLIGGALGRVHDGSSVVGDAPARRWPLLRRVLRGVVTKHTFEAVDDLLDGLRFRIDTLPNGLYQPVDGLSIRAARATGSESRWAAIRSVVEAHNVSSAVDIGACEGYFALKLAAAGVPTIAVESEPSNYRTALLAVKRHRTRNVGVLALEVTPENVALLAAADCVLCLSVWHHFVRSYGLDRATAMLEAIWERTRIVLFFDTGETEMTPDYGLPAMKPDPQSWLSSFLARTCAGSRIEHLGSHRAFDPVGEPCERNLFAVIRRSSGRLPD